MKKALPALYVLVLMVVASTAHAICSSDDWCWVNPLPQGNDVNDIHYVDAQTAWAAGDHGTLLRTLDGGTTWTAIDSGTRENLYAVHFIDSSHGWVSGGNGVLLRTDDGGEHWSNQILNNYPHLKDVQFLDAQNGWAVGYGSATYFPCPPNICFSQGEYVYKTIDGGNSWQDKHDGTFGQDNPEKVAFVDANHGWVLAGGEIYRTADGGENWEKLVPENSLGSTDITFKDVFLLNANQGWAVGRGCIIVTGDGGNTWSFQPEDTHEDLYAVHIQDADHGWVAGSRTFLYTNDGGAAWVSHSQSARTENQFFRTVSAFGSDNVFVAGLNGALFSASDGGALLTPYTSDFAYESDLPNFVDVDFPDADQGWIVNFSPDTFYRTQDGGDTWQLRQTGVDVLYNAVSFIDTTTGWAVGKNGTIVHTQNGGDSWTPQTSGTTQELLSVHFISQTRGWATGVGLILATDDGGLTWTSQYTTAGSEYIYDASFLNAQVGWATGSGRLVLYTANGGATWDPQSIGSADILYVRSVAAVSPTVVVAVGTSAIGSHGRILRTDDGGATWNLVDSGVDEVFREVRFADASHGWIVGNAGVILSTDDGGLTWAKEDSGTNQGLRALCVRNANHRWAVGSYGTVLDNAGGGSPYDYLGDGDVDGADLAMFVGAFSEDEVPDFALAFGRVN